MEEEFKKCKICGEVKSIINWPKDRDKFRPCCRACFLENKRKSQKKNRALNKEQTLEKERIYREKNRERIKQKHKEWVSKNRDYVNAKARESGKKWRRENLEWARKRKREYERKNEDKIKEHRRRSYERKKNNNPAFFLVERIKKTIRAIMKKGIKKAHNTLHYVGCLTIEEFLQKMSEKTENKNWITDNYNIDHMMQRHWFNEFLKENPESVELIAEIMNNHSNLRPLKFSDNMSRSLLDVSFIDEKIFNEFSKFWNSNIVSCAKFYLENKQLFSGKTITKGSTEEDILLNIISGCNKFV